MAEKSSSWSYDAILITGSSWSVPDSDAAEDSRQSGGGRRSAVRRRSGDGWSVVG
ncbi:hypothetical protein [Brevibacterium oceani]|uniref:hypothetical protein n=1 Tax=Brevibacterium oceani TaxID=358099 RepID=UPI001B3248A6|nr:hypothetical protein [Brevibacterium oceani]